MSENGKPKCLIDGCERESVARGLCTSHRAQASVRVKAGITTWEELVRLGLAADRKRAKAGTFDLALEAARKKLND